MAPAKKRRPRKQGAIHAHDTEAKIRATDGERSRFTRRSERGALGGAAQRLPAQYEGAAPPQRNTPRPRADQAASGPLAAQGQGCDREGTGLRRRAHGAGARRARRGGRGSPVGPAPESASTRAPLPADPLRGRAPPRRGQAGRTSQRSHGRRRQGRGHGPRPGRRVRAAPSTAAPLRGARPSPRPRYVGGDRRGPLPGGAIRPDQAVQRPPDRAPLPRAGGRQCARRRGGGGPAPSRRLRLGQARCRPAGRTLAPRDHALARGRAVRPGGPCSRWSSRRAASTRSVFISPPSACRCWAMRPTGPPRTILRFACAGRCCTPGRWASCIPSRARRCGWRARCPRTSARRCSSFVG